METVPSMLHSRWQIPPESAPLHKTVERQDIVVYQSGASVAHDRGDVLPANECIWSNPAIGTTLLIYTLSILIVGYRDDLKHQPMMSLQAHQTGPELFDENHEFPRNGQIDPIAPGLSKP